MNYFYIGLTCAWENGAFGSKVVVKLVDGKPSKSECVKKCIEMKFNEDASITAIHYNKPYKACRCIKDERNPKADKKTDRCVIK